MLFKIEGNPKKDLDQSQVEVDRLAAAFQIIVGSLKMSDSDWEIEDGEGNIFGVSDGFQAFLDTGLLGAVVLAIIGSLIWRIMASSFPLAFMSNPLVYVIIRVCLIIEGTGICSAAWLLSLILKPIAGYQPDEVYIDLFAEEEKDVGETKELMTEP